ncbi:MAG: M16 family metallopeptidase [Atribacter sp.]|jgi:zinc protease|uniref:M16 family metallopeptidase n=1 Tax=Atribacter sp. TaxID=2847780 RepID=UPI003D9615AE|nr:pitrilysin family protein [Atribacterota bacterium]
MNLSYTKKVFPSDLKVVFRRMKSPLVTLNLWARVGVKDEEPVQIGISHFFEHMVFKGTTNYPGLELSRQVQAIGGNINAGTSLDTTDFYIVVPNNHWEKSLELIIDLVNNPLFNPIDIEREKKVIIQEIHLDEDDPEEKLDTTLYHEVFSGTPYERSILGSKDTIAHLKRENFIYHQEYFYHPSNLTLVVCGDLPENQLFEKIDQFYKNGGKPLQNLFSSFPPLPKVQRKRIEINMDIHHHYGAIGFLGPGIRQDDFCLLKFLSVILGDGIDSRLNARLREKEQLVDSIHTNFSYYQESGIFSIIFTFANSDPKKIEAIIQEECELLLNHPPQDIEIKRAKNLLLSGFYHSIETTLGSAELLGRLDTINTIDTVFRYLKNIQNVQTKQIIDVLKKYLDFNFAVSVIINPEDHR